MSAYSDTIRKIGEGNVAPVYLLAGGDTFLEDFFIDEIARNFLPAGVRKVVFSLDDDRTDQVLAELSAYSLFQDRQLLVVRQAQRIVGAARKELLIYVENPDPGKCLLLVLEDYQPSKGLHKGLAKHIPIVDTRPPFLDQLRSWTSYYTQLKKYTLHPDALNLLLDFAGDSAGHVMSELDKIFIGLDQGSTVTRELVEAQVNPDRQYQLWHLQEAIARRETVQSLRICVSLTEYGTQPTRIVVALSTLFCQLFFIQTGTRIERGYTGLNKPVTARLNAMKDLYPLVETNQILKRLLAADVYLKSTNVEPEQLLIALVAGICRGIK